MRLKLIVIAASASLLLPAASAATPQDVNSAQSKIVDHSSVGAQALQDGVPRLIQFNGTLKDAASRPIGGVASVTFAIYNEQDNGTALWSETQNVLADANGHYTVLIGAATANGVPSNLFGTGETRWLGVTIARQPEMPRVLMASVPYALKAGDADTLGGLPASSYVTVGQLAARGTSTPVGSSNGTTIIATSAIDPAPASQVVTPGASQSVIQASPTGGGTTDYIPLWTSGSNLGNSILFQSGSSLGLGTTTPASTLDINGGEILRGGFYEYPQGTATAAAGQPSHSFQWLASVFDSATSAPVYRAFGFRAIPVDNDSSNPAAKLDLFAGSGGPTGSLTDTGLSISNSGIITFVPAQTFSGSAASLTAINLPATTAVGTGQINFGGAAFITDLGDQSDIFVGYQAAGGNKFTEPSNGGNTAVGWRAMYALTDGQRNSAFGDWALTAVQSAPFDTGIGAFALSSDVSSGFNTGVGGYALTNTTGQYNTGVGENAGANITTGNENTALGSGAGPSVGTLSNTTGIGADAQPGESNSLILGSTDGPGGSVPAVSVGIGTSTPRTNLDVSALQASSFAAPNPILTLSNGSTGTSNSVAIDFEPAIPAGTLPFARIQATGQSTGSTITFLSNTNGSGNGSLQQTLSIDSQGNVQIAGSLYVTGEVEKGGGTFKIDDPIDPANKYLSHSFVESPDMMNIYNGNVVTDANGFATVDMPRWFESLNADFRYQLTVLGQFAEAIVASEMQNGKFTIRTDKPNVKVSWQVTGIRHDPFAVAHRTPIEEPKPASEQGRYLHPELYGARDDQRVRDAVATSAIIPASVRAASESNP